MATDLRFITGNGGKVMEMQHALLGLDVNVVQDARGYPEIQADSLADVAHAGAQHLLADGARPPFILEDAGLFVQALRGFPGVYSRYTYDTIGCAGILRLLQGLEPEMRVATFQAQIALVTDEVQLFEGNCKGRIADRTAGDGGFGFDPIFIPDGQQETFAQMDRGAKGAVSHRGKAAAALRIHLESSGALSN